MATQVTVNEVDAPAGLRLGDAHDVTLYPEQVSDDRGVYPAEAVNLADALQARGVVALPWHDLDHCDWSTASASVSAFRLGVASTAGWSAVREAMRQRVNRVRLTVGWWTGENERWVRLEGDAPEVAAALDNLR
jgi:hypothetical protein